MTVLYEEIVDELHTIIDFLRFGISEAQRQELFYGHGTDKAEDDIWALILGSLSLPLDVDPLLLQARLTLKEKKILRQQLSARIHDRIPVPYLTHEAYFCDLPFYVDERVLIPRSPIAELIRAQFSPWVEAESVSRILELGTGSGCIAIACYYAFPEALIDAVDISPLALEVAGYNRDKHGLTEDELRLIESDCFDKVPSERYDIIVSNPPYVGDEEMASLPMEYRHEPKQALWSGHNGLAMVAEILKKARQYLKPQGILVVEVGNSAEALVEAFPDLPFTWLDFEHGGSGVFLLSCEQLVS